ncbi:MAG: tetratricopeptide repeat protein [Bacteroidales bacterium]|nr:tetratricopeptide repeat protein [Bacteroidales bacterium]HOY39897.1 tetratricopeptide repeat protein [Bacteroidales bacterium]HQP05170.1 tetratricopeptide repeat protein [Bacteroidales bacterium]
MGKPNVKKEISKKGSHPKQAVQAKPVSFLAQAIAVVVLLIATILAYQNGMRGMLLNFDDVEYFFNYPEVVNLSWESVKTYFSGYYVLMYQPLPILSFALNYHFTGLNTFPMHMVNLFFHLSNIILVYFLTKNLSKRFDVSIIVAALFALHPMNIEAVTWISARSSGMYTFFYLLSLIFYVKYIRSELKWKYIVAAILFFIFSLFSKAQAVTLPVVLLAIDYYMNRKLISWRVVLEKIPFFILSVIFGLVAISEEGTVTNMTQGMMIHYTTFESFFLVCYSFVFYLYKLFVPFSLSAIYVFPPKVNGYLPMIYYLSPVILALLTFLFFRFARKKRYIVFGLAIFLITISLNIQIIPSRLFIVTDRYGYFPYLGLFFIIACFISENRDKKFLNAKMAFVLPALLILYLCAFTITIYRHNKVWDNDIVFMTHLIEKNPEVPYISRAYGNRGHAYFELADYRTAISDFNNAVRIKPDDAKSYFNLGASYLKLKEYEQAISSFDSAAKYEPKQMIIYENRAIARFNLKDYEGTIRDCRYAISLDSTVTDLFNLRGVSRYYIKDFKGAEEDFSKCIRLNPQYGEAYKNRGYLYQEMQRLSEACSDWNHALEYGFPEVQEAINLYCK